MWERSLTSLPVYRVSSAISFFSDDDEPRGPVTVTTRDLIFMETSSGMEIVSELKMYLMSS